MAAPVGAAAGLAAPELTRDPADAARGGSAIIEMRSVPEPGADGGQDLVIDVTAAL